MKSLNVRGIILHDLRPCLLETFSAYLAALQRVTPILTHSLQGKKVQAISATQLLKMDTRTT